MRAWIAGLLAACLVLVLPACWASWLTDTVVESDGGECEPRIEEEPEHRAHCKLRAIPRIPAAPQQATDRVSVPSGAPALLASIAPKSHPSRFSVRRQQ
jgi:hypothetical protein